MREGGHNKFLSCLSDGALVNARAGGGGEGQARAYVQAEFGSPAPNARFAAALLQPFTRLTRRTPRQLPEL